MSSFPRIEHRCTCGKLLFKGILLGSVVEIKCRRCGALLVVGDLRPGACAIVDADTRATITDARGDVRTVLGRASAQELIGTQLHSLFPALRDSADATGTVPHSDYVIKNDVRLIHDGEKQHAQTYLTEIRENGIHTGYRVISWSAIC